MNPSKPIGFGTNPYTRRFRGLIPVKPKDAPEAIDGNTTFADFYHEPICADTPDDLLDAYDALRPADQRGPRGTDILHEVSDRIDDLYFSSALREAFPPLEATKSEKSLSPETLQKYVHLLKDSLLKGNEFDSIRDDLSGVENGQSLPEAILKKHFPLKSEKRVNSVATPEPPQAAPLQTMRSTHWTNRPVRKRLRTEIQMIAQQRPSPLQHQRSNPTKLDDYLRSSPLRRTLGSRATLDARPTETSDRRPVPCFQSAAEALAEANARMGGGPAFKRPGLSKLHYTPAFARPEPEAKPSEAAQRPKKQKTEDDESLDGLPGYLLTEDGAALHPRVASCDPKLLATVCREIMDLHTKVTWDDIAGLKTAKDTLEEVIIWPLLRPDIFTGLRGPPKGILLFGPPGTGKTLLARAVASQTGCTFFNISSSSLMSKWIGDGEKMVRCLFAIASVRQPSVVFIDEIDSLLSARTEGEQDAVRRIKTEFLVQLDGAATESADRVLVIGATNRPEELDEAARRRLERRLYVALPDAASRHRIIEHLLRNEPNALGEADMAAIVARTAKYSGADMKALCREAAMRPLRECRSLKSVAVDDVRAIAREDFEKAVQTIRPTVSDTEIRRYAEWNAAYGSTAMGDGV